MKHQLFLQYLKQTIEAPKKKEPGPVVTISREFGCPGIPLADKLTETLGRKSKGQTWRKIDRELIDMAADALKLSSDVVDGLIRERNPGLFHDIFSTIFFLPSFWPLGASTISQRWFVSYLPSTMPRPSQAPRLSGWLFGLGRPHRS